VLALISLGLIAAAPASLIHIARYRGPMDIVDPTGYVPVLRCVTEFTLGILCWRVSKLAAMERRWLPTLACAALLILLAVRGSDIAIVLLLPIFIGSLSRERSLAAKALGSRPFRWLGEISYSLYLVHTLCPSGRRQALRVLTLHHVPHPNIVQNAGFLMLTLAIAQATYWLIERPGRELLRGAFESHRTCDTNNWLKAKLPVYTLIMRKRCLIHDVKMVEVESNDGGVWSSRDSARPTCQPDLVENPITSPASDCIHTSILQAHKCSPSAYSPWLCWVRQLLRRNRKGDIRRGRAIYCNDALSRSGGAREHPGRVESVDPLRGL
jgi:hypothetical protein